MSLTNRSETPLADMPEEATIDVFLLPLGPARYELYSEIDQEQPVVDRQTASRGWFGRLEDRFSTLMQAIAKRPSRVPMDGSWWERLKVNALGWLAERVAEQRLLWHLRRCVSATLVHPDDMTAADAHAIVRQQLAADLRRHRMWLGVDLVWLLASAVLTVIPGPNIVALYFSFRVVGHYLSIRGASHGLDQTAWTYESSAPLAELRRAITLAPPLRDARVLEVVARLRLRHLETFVRRVALRSA